MKYRILNTIGEAFAPEAKQILSQLGDVDYRIPTQAELEEIIPEYDGAVIGLGLVFDKSVLEKAARLKTIATATTGLDHIDVAVAKEKGIEILSLKEETEFLNSITGTAELGWGLVIDLLRKTPAAFDSVRAGEWKREKFMGRNLYEKTLGVVGLGRLGRWMARYGKAFGMRVIFCDPNVESSPDATKVSFDELLRESDVVSINVYLTTETENMFTEVEFKKMKPDAILINTARGKIVNEVDVLRALEGKWIAGYATDVLANETTFTGGVIKRDYRLVEYSKSHENLIIVPHIGGMTSDSRTKTDIFIAKKMAKMVNSNTDPFVL